MPNLLLIPTSFERRIFDALGDVRTRLDSALSGRWRIECCGFGLVGAAARTMQLISIHRPRRIMLLGIAGSLDESIPIGSACAFDRVTCHGIGIGDALAADHKSADELGWSHIEPIGCASAIGDTIELAQHRRLSVEAELIDQPMYLISVTAAAADTDEARRRRERFPDAVAEDMEGFGVAVAAHLAAVPLQIVRGISNLAGDRNHDHWQVAAALRSACELATKLVGEDL